MQFLNKGETFPCQYCEYKAKQKGNLKTHIQSIHEGKTFQCQYCVNKATQKCNIKTHIQSIHFNICILI